MNRLVGIILNLYGKTLKVLETEIKILCVNQLFQPYHNISNKEFDNFSQDYFILTGYNIQKVFPKEYDLVHRSNFYKVSLYLFQA